MQEVLPQDIESGKNYYVEYWGRSNPNDESSPHRLLKKYYGRIDDDGHNILSLRNKEEIKNGTRIPRINHPAITSKPESPTTMEEEKAKRDRNNYYYKFFPKKETDNRMFQSVINQKTNLDSNTTRGLTEGWLGGKKRKTNKRRKSNKNKRKKTKRRYKKRK